MDYSLKTKELKAKYEKLQSDLHDTAILSDPKKVAETNKEFHEVRNILDKLEKLEEITKSLKENELIVESQETPELSTLAADENEQLLSDKKELETALLEYFSPQNPLDKKNVILEIRAGTGGDESALFSADLFRMYSRFAENQGWQTSIVSSNRIGIGGFKEIIFEVNGQGAYGWLKYESGVHRVQRVPETEKSGRVHTSAASVVILPEADEVDIRIEPQDTKIDVFRSSGPGGQSVNTTDSAVRVTHLPSGIVVTCQDEKSQHQNRDKAMQILRSRLLAQAEEEKAKEISSKRKIHIGTGDRSEKIRTYNFPQDRLTDHRLKKNWHNLDKIMAGQIKKIIEELKKADQ